MNPGRPGPLPCWGAGLTGVDPGAIVGRMRGCSRISTFGVSPEWKQFLLVYSRTFMGVRMTDLE